MKLLKVAIVFAVLTAFLATFASAQKPRPKIKPAKSQKQVIFAVIVDGKTVEPIAFVEKGKLTETETGESTNSELTDFGKTYYTPGASYGIIFGGAKDGELSIKSASKGECSGNSAEVSSVPVKAVLGGFVMALATNASDKVSATGTRRRPTAAERTEIEALVRAEFVKNKAEEKSVKTLRNHNLTAIDVDRDGKAELVGSYWFAPKSDQRNLLFFIAQKNEKGKYALAHSEFEEITPEGIMSGEVKDLDAGIYHELLLDTFDYDGDGVGEIFTTSQAFEGRNFHVYRREGKKWTKSFESYNYRCGY